jgi:hypothetical protein
MRKKKRKKQVTLEENAWIIRLYLRDIKVSFVVDNPKVLCCCYIFDGTGSKTRRQIKCGCSEKLVSDGLE